MKAKITLSNIKGFLQGNFRKFVEDLPGFVPDHVYEQIQYRIGIMDINCLEKKKCPCECIVPQKQYEDRACENNCYPPIMTEEQWEKYKDLVGITKETISQKLYERKDLL